MADETVEIFEGAGVPEGHIEVNGEKVVYDRDEEGNVVGWHKEATE